MIFPWRSIRHSDDLQIMGLYEDLMLALRRICYLETSDFLKQGVLIVVSNPKTTLLLEIEYSAAPHAAVYITLPRSYRF